MNSKTDLRKRYRALLESAADADGGAQAPARDALNERLVDYLKTSSGTWAAFQPCGFEPAILPALARLTQIDWVFPRVEGDSLGFYRVAVSAVAESAEGVLPCSPSAPLIAGSFGIREPDPAACERVALEEITGFLVPGLVFDAGCRRLGRGKGYYDRALAAAAAAQATALAAKLAATLAKNPARDNTFKNNGTTATHAFKLGIAHDRQISDTEIPVEPYDVVMDGVLTETRYFGRTPADGAGLGRSLSSERIS